MDHFDRLPDSVLLIIFNKIGDVKALGISCVVSRRFHGLVPQVDEVVVKVDCVISDEDNTTATDSTKGDGSSGGAGFGNLFRFVVSGIVKPVQAVIGQFIGSSKKCTSEDHEGGVTHHSPTQVLKHFNEIRKLRIELPTGELGVEDGVMLKWRADFGSTLDNCVILGASSVVHPEPKGEEEKEKEEDEEESPSSPMVTDQATTDDNGIPDSFYTSGGLKLRVVWSISSLIAASARHYLLHPIIAEHHTTLDNLILTDADGQGVLCMNKEQLEELRSKPLSVSTASRRTLVPALNMRLWYAPELELSNGAILKGATLVAIQPCDQTLKKGMSDDSSWVSDAFEEPYNKAVKLLIKRRTYCLEMNSF